MSGRATRNGVVLSKQQLTQNMIRVIVGGEDFKHFPQGQESGYVKLLFSPEEGKDKPRMRSYTIRAFDAEKAELTLDFVAHGDNGPASAWVMNARVGDVISINGPGPAKLVDMRADWFFIMGDMTALPAIAVNLEKLPNSARGYAVIEVLSEDDKQHLEVPSGIDVHWVINPHPDQPNQQLYDYVKALPWLEGQPNVWLATEFDAMRALRRYFKEERSVKRDQIYASSYWKMGETDEGNKAAKKQDTEA